jgi:hypothetical protein
MPHLRNTVHVTYALRSAPGVITSSCGRTSTSARTGQRRVAARALSDTGGYAVVSYHVEECDRGVEVLADGVHQSASRSSPRTVRLLPERKP